MKIQFHIGLLSYLRCVLSKGFSSPYFHTKVLHTLLIALMYVALPRHKICLGSIALPYKPSLTFLQFLAYRLLVCPNILLYTLFCSQDALLQCFSTFVRLRPGEFFVYKTTARSQQITGKYLSNLFFSSYVKLT